MVASLCLVVDLTIACADRVEIYVEIDVLGLRHNLVDGAAVACVANLCVAGVAADSALEDVGIVVAQTLGEGEAALLHGCRKVVDVTFEFYAFEEDVLGKEGCRHAVNSEGVSRGGLSSEAERAAGEKCCKKKPFHSYVVLV